MRMLRLHLRARWRQIRNWQRVGLSIALGIVLAVLLRYGFGLSISDVFPSQAALWWQAGASLAAVFSALWIATHQSRQSVALETRRQKRETEIQNLRAQATFSRLASLVTEIEQAIDTALKIANAFPVNENPPINVLAGQLDKLLLNVWVPDDIYRDFWTLPRQTVFQMSHTLYSIGVYERRIERMVSMAVSSTTPLPASQIRKIPNAAAQQLRRLKNDVEKCIPLLGTHWEASFRNISPLL